MRALKYSDTLLRKLEHIKFGSLELTTPDGRSHAFEGQSPGANVNLNMRDWSVFCNLATKGDLGFAEDYKKGKWHTPNLQDLLSFALQNEHAVKDYVFGSSFTQLMARMSYLFRLNTLKGSRKNIHAHYDLGNDFYSLWLDPSMTYSSALYDDTGCDQAAQMNKYDRIINRLHSNGGKLLEVGCGWGGFAARAQEKGDFDYKGITLSNEQFDHCKERFSNDSCTNFALEDYRHQEEKYDHIVSIEMFEAVGERYWPTYFQMIADNLKQGGKAVIQSITIGEQHFERYRRGGDFIRSYIFPGGMLPTVSRFHQEAEAAGLRVNDTFEFGQDYARTLEFWLDRFDEKRDDVKALGFDDGFIRIWRYYLASCIAGFRTERTNVMQVELEHA